jgi:hypothetical protein
MKLYCLFFLLLIYSCSIKKESVCNENLSFKNAFFRNIEIVENHTLRKEGKNDILTALDFISKYADVSYDKIYNYEIRYPNIEDFNQDKANWIKWYESNKCNNIQFKNNNTKANNTN